MSATLALGALGQLQLPEEAQFGVLLLDDQQDFLDTTRDSLKLRGIDRVATAKNQREAEAELAKHAYDAILADVWLKGIDRIEDELGHKWLLKARVKNAPMRVALTGQWGMIEDPGELDRGGIRVVRKADREEMELYDELGALADQKRRDTLKAVAKQISEAAGGMTTMPDDRRDVFESAAAQLFVDWVKSRGAAADEETWIGGQRFTVADLAHQVREDTETGRRLLRMFVRHLRARLGLERP